MKNINKTFLVIVCKKYDDYSDDISLKYIFLLQGHFKTNIKYFYNDKGKLLG